ncbi:MAG: hypothetical protein ACRCXK_03070 [Wohlfahrtiimonas sp.]
MTQIAGEKQLNSGCHRYSYFETDHASNHFPVKPVVLITSGLIFG